MLAACAPATPAPATIIESPSREQLTPTVPLIPSVPAFPAARATLTPTSPTPLTTHPRLWLTSNDLPRLRASAVASNAFYRDALSALATKMKAEMDAGRVPAQDTGAADLSSPYSAEASAQLFAFLSLVENDASTRADYARRARVLLMHVIGNAASGAATGKPFRDPQFAIRERSFAYGDALPLTVDWIYATLTPDDKAQIKKVFLRWINENLNANIASVYEHPQPVGAINSAALTDSTFKIRWATSHRYANHLRNIGLMALALDAADDADGALRGYVKNATGAWLYVFDYATRYEIRGGLPAQGLDYGTEQLGAVAQFLLALKTAGQDHPAQYGAPVVLAQIPFWNDVITAYLASTVPARGARGYALASYGDTRGDAAELVALFAPLGIYHALIGNAERANAARWLAQNYQLPISNYSPRDSILAFLLHDPAERAPTDPRAPMPREYFASGIGRVLARTDWSDDATFVTYKLGWNTIDYQHADANQIEFFRRGEWLTKGRAGQGAQVGSSDYHNTLAMENAKPATILKPSQQENFARGSQWFYNSNGDGILHALAFGDDYLYLLGDATTLYDSNALQSTDIVHVSRALLWLKPDHLIIYDRADSGTAGRFKRFWLNTPTRAQITGNRATITTAQNQRLYLTTLMPANAMITAQAAEAFPNEAARDDPMQFRLRVQAPLTEKSVRFLNVLQGADAGVNADALALIESGKEGTRYAGVVIAGATAVLFRENEFTPFQSVTYRVPATTMRHYVTGLQPNGLFEAKIERAGEQIQVTITVGGNLRADNAGVLVIK